MLHKFLQDHIILLRTQKVYLAVNSCTSRKTQQHTFLRAIPNQGQLPREIALRLELDKCFNQNIESLALIQIRYCNESQRLLMTFSHHPMILNRLLKTYTIPKDSYMVFSATESFCVFADWFAYNQQSVTCGQCSHHASRL